MARQENTDVNTPPAPALHAPREAAVVDGSQVTFRWEPVEGATEYCLQIARDGSFEDVVLDETFAAGEPSKTVSGRFNDDGETYFWRVLARNEAGWSNGDHVESFIAGSAEQARALLGTPDEKYGPYPELIRSAGIEAAAEVTGDEDLYEEEALEGVEHEGVEVGQILGLAIATLAAVIVAIVSVFMVYDQAARVTRAEAILISGYPDLQEVNLEATQQLSQYDVIDADADRYQIPIDRAMGLLIQEQPRRPAAAYSGELPLLPGYAPGPDGPAPVLSE